MDGPLLIAPSILPLHQAFGTDDRLISHEIRNKANITPHEVRRMTLTRGAGTNTTQNLISNIHNIGLGDLCLAEVK